jgi:nucleoside-diphosphate kinase
LEVYEFLPEYMKIVEHLLSGPCVALEVRHEDPVIPFRELCGPFDPSIAKQLRPNSIRARFGLDRVCNAVHCTDLPEDGQLEVQYFFHTLANL